jgi:predicted lipid carrier protein YhbT
LNEEPAADFSVSPEQFAKLIAEASDEDIAAIVSGPARKQILDEIFNRMADHVEPAQLGDRRATVHFQILDRPDDLGGGVDLYEVRFADGACTVGEAEGDPDVTLKVGPVEFLKLAANRASGPMLFMNGKLRVEGDVMLANELTRFFRIPSAA